MNDSLSQTRPNLNSNSDSSATNTGDNKSKTSESRLKTGDVRLQRSLLSEPSDARDCVYLRPEQNIPDGFSSKFKPIAELEDKGDSFAEEKSDIYTSSDDIVLTLRSVQV